MAKITAAELHQYMVERNNEKIVVEAVNVNVPKMQYQAPRILPKRFIVVYAANGNTSNNPLSIDYMVPPLYKEIYCTVPRNFEFIIIEGDDAKQMLDTYTATKQAFEADFRAAYESYHAKIAEHVRAAEDALAKAIALSDETGVPFRPDDLCGFSMSYVPKTFKEKFGESSEIRDLAAELTNAYGGGYNGWQSSQTC